MGSAASVVLRCEICSVELPTIFDKKKCGMCSKMVCSKCLDSSEGSIQILGKRFCRKCFKLRSGNFTRKDLDSYSVRELRNFLLGKSISLQGCREKNDLTELTLRCSNCEASVDQSSLEHSRHIELLRERMRIETSEAIHNVPSYPPSHSFDHFQHEQYYSANNGDISERPSEENAAVTNRSGLSLSDIKEESELAQLSVHQLKEILAKNCIHFKGCCEKSELHESVARLWRQHKRTKDVDDIDALSIKDLCKICMDATMDCLLLECGHMVSCTACGKRLSECPICRCLVSRVVHVFRS